MTQIARLDLVRYFLESVPLTATEFKHVTRFHVTLTRVRLEGVDRLVSTDAQDAGVCPGPVDRGEAAFNRQ